MHYRMDAATLWLVRRKDAFLRETGTRKALLVTFVTPDGLASNGRIGLAESEVTCAKLPALWHISTTMDYTFV